MRSYRLYVVTPQENISAAFEKEYRNDQEALARAACLQQERHAVEVWSGERLVGRVGSAFDFGRPATSERTSA